MNNTDNNCLQGELPSSPETEKTVLGAILLDNALMPSVVRQINPSFFHNSRHRRIFDAMLVLFDQGEEINYLTIKDVLEKNNDNIGYAELSNLTFGLPHYQNVDSFIKILREYAQARWFYRYATQIQNMVCDLEFSERIAEFAESRLIEFQRELKSDDKSPKLIGDLIPATLERYARYKAGDFDTIPTGFDFIDRRLTGQGLTRGHLIILAARPKLGKTCLSLDIADSAASLGFLAYVASLEMTDEALIDRLIAGRSGVERFKISPGLHGLEYDLANQHLVSIKDSTLIIDQYSRTTQQITHGVKEIENKLNRQVDLILVDHLQLMGTKDRGNRNDQVGDNSAELLNLAKDKHAAVVALSQLSRRCEHEKRAPELRDLRDSGEIEQNARTVFFLYATEAHSDKVTYDYDTDAAIRPMMIKCAKQGDGAEFKARMNFYQKLTTFRSFSSHRPIQDYNRKENYEEAI